MIKQEFEQKMEKYAKQIEITLSKKQMEQFYQYMQILLEWNEKINLTAITKPKEIILKHFIDSITIAKHIGPHSRLIDVGTGAGFPGIPLKIIREDIEITLLDSLHKRICFLEEVMKQLELKKIEAIHARVEEFSRDKKYRESFDYATSRAVANLATLSEYLLPLVKIKGACLCMKGANIKEEIERSRKAIMTLGGKIEKIEEFQLPESDIERQIVLLRKINQTSSKYPRKPGMPSKQPIV